MEVLDRVWLAAVLDSEGSLGLRIVKVKRHSGRFGYILVPTVGFGNTSLQLIEHGEAILKGVCRIQEYKNKRFYWLQVRVSAIHQVLTELLPYFVAKKALARKILSWLDYRSKHHHYTSVDVQFVKEIWKIQSKHPEKLKYLSEFGVYVRAHEQKIPSVREELLLKALEQGNAYTVRELADLTNKSYDDTYNALKALRSKDLVSVCYKGRKPYWFLSKLVLDEKLRS